MSLNINTLLHDLFLVSVTAASVFVKNPASQQHAATLIQLANSLLNQIEPPAPPAA